eukprot:163778-Ditylum_brightwellii.AAC.1
MASPLVALATPDPAEAVFHGVGRAVGIRGVLPLHEVPDRVEIFLWSKLDCGFIISRAGCKRAARVGIATSSNIVAHVTRREQQHHRGSCVSWQTCLAA